MERITVSRRALLGGVAGLGAVSLTGCLKKVPFVGASTRYRKWLPSPEEGDTTYSDFTVLHPGAIATQEAVPESFEVATQPYAPVDRVAGTVGFGVPFEDVTAILGYGNVGTGQFPVHVVWGPHETESLETHLREHGYQRRSEYEGFDVWGRQLWDGTGTPPAAALERGRAVAFDGDVLVTSIVATGAHTQLEHLKTAIKAGKGAVRRLDQDSNTATELLKRLRQGDFRVYRTFPPVEPAIAGKTPGRFAGQVGKAIRFDVKGETTKLRLVYAFETGEAADPEAVQEYLEGLRGMTPTTGAGAGTSTENATGSATPTVARPYGEFQATVEKEGRSVVVDGSLPTADLTMKRWP